MSAAAGAGAWPARGLRRLGALLTRAADWLERPSLAPGALEPRPPRSRPEDLLADVRQRIHTHYY